jgi:hypothetical protein
MGPLARIRLDVSRLQNRQSPFTGHGAAALVSIDHEYAKCTLTESATPQILRSISVARNIFGFRSLVGDLEILRQSLTDCIPERRTLGRRRVIGLAEYSGEDDRSFRLNVTDYSG